MPRLKIAVILFIVLFCMTQFLYFLVRQLEDETNEDFIDDVAHENDMIILWWTPFIKGARRIQCGDVSCLVTNDRKWVSDEKTAILFYGSNFEPSDLPLPRTSRIWGLLHEESPRNSPYLNHETTLSLFNYSSTFSRYSDIPLTLQFLPWLESLTSTRYYKTIEDKMKLNLSDVVYIQSDCSTPNNRDSYVNELMKFISIDSYGACLNNKKIPESLSNSMKTMMSPELLELVGNYKFAIAFENAICEDYITEKLWRPLIAGSVPIYVGSPSAKEWIPNEKSVIFVSDFKTPQKLANYLHALIKKPKKYNNHLRHKIEKKIDNNFLVKQFNNFERSVKSFGFIKKFECLICKNLFKNKKSIISQDHYNCPAPVSILNREINTSNWWYNDYLKSECESSILRKIIDKSLPVNYRELGAHGLKHLNENECGSILKYDFLY